MKTTEEILEYLKCRTGYLEQLARIILKEGDLKMFDAITDMKREAELALSFIKGEDEPEA